MRDFEGHHVRDSWDRASSRLPRHFNFLKMPSKLNRGIPYDLRNSRSCILSMACIDCHCSGLTDERVPSAAFISHDRTGSRLEQVGMTISVVG